MALFQQEIEGSRRLTQGRIYQPTDHLKHLTTISSVLWPEREFVDELVIVNVLTNQKEGTFYLQKHTTPVLK